MMLQVVEVVVVVVVVVVVDLCSFMRRFHGPL